MSVLLCPDQPNNFLVSVSATQEETVEDGQEKQKPSQQLLQRSFAFHENFPCTWPPELLSFLLLVKK